MQSQLLSEKLKQTLYVGHTTKVPERISVYIDGRERQLKRWSHAKKFALINGDRPQMGGSAGRH